MGQKRKVTKGGYDLVDKLTEGERSSAGENEAPRSFTHHGHHKKMSVVEHQKMLSCI